MKRLVLTISVATLAVVAIVAAGAMLCEPGGAESAGPVPKVSRDDRIAVASPLAPKVDSVIDLSTGSMKPLPDSIIRTLGKLDEGGLYPPSPERAGHPDPASLSPYAPAFISRYAASRDGSRLAFVGRGDEGRPQIFIARIEGSGVRQLTDDPGGANSPAWSPDGSMIAYNGSADDGSRRLVVLDVDTGESTPLPEAGHVQPWRGGQFTPDGSSLLYSSGSSLRTVPIDGGKSTAFIGRAEGMNDAFNGSLAPDGSLVTMMGSEIGGPGAIRFVSNSNGTERRFILGSFSNPAGTWSPDGRRIVCAGRDRQNYPVVVVDVATGRVSPVAKGNGAIWLDGHTLLVEVW
jgi:Tol biopolymer transport system component